MSIALKDCTTRKDWLDKHVVRLSGYEILRRVLRGQPFGLQASELHESCAIGKLEPHYIHREKLVKGIMGKLNARNSEEAIITLRKLLDERR